MRWDIKKNQVLYVNGDPSAATVAAAEAEAAAAKSAALAGGGHSNPSNVLENGLQEKILPFSPRNGSKIFAPLLHSVGSSGCAPHLLARAPKKPKVGVKVGVKSAPFPTSECQKWGFKVGPLLAGGKARGQAQESDRSHR